MYSGISWVFHYIILEIRKNLNGFNSVSVVFWTILKPFRNVCKTGIYLMRLAFLSSRFYFRTRFLSLTIIYRDTNDLHFWINDSRMYICGYFFRFRSWAKLGGVHKRFTITLFFFRREIFSRRICSDSFTLISILVFQWTFLTGLVPSSRT